MCLATFCAQAALWKWALVWSWHLEYSKCLYNVFVRFLPTYCLTIQNYLPLFCMINKRHHWCYIDYFLIASLFMTHCCSDQLERRTFVFFLKTILWAPAGSLSSVFLPLNCYCTFEVLYLCVFLANICVGLFKNQLERRAWWQDLDLFLAFLQAPAGSLSFLCILITLGVYFNLFTNVHYCTFYRFTLIISDSTIV